MRRKVINNVNRSIAMAPVIAAVRRQVLHFLRYVNWVILNSLIKYILLSSVHVQGSKIGYRSLFNRNVNY